MRTLVIIDDEPVLRSLLARHLEAQGWHVFEADNGDQGLELVRRHLLMPGTNGFKVCRTLRAQRATLGEITIIVTTGSGFPADKQNALEAGANHYLIKPVSPQEVGAILAHVRPEAGDPIPPPPAPVEEVRVRFWGVRGAIASPGPATVRYGGNTTCVEVRAGDDLVVLDAGTGIRPLGESLQREFAGRPIQATLLLTHTHWGHIQGLPFFGPASAPGNRVTVLGYEGARQGLQQTLAAQMDPAFFPGGQSQPGGSLTVRELHQLEFQVGRLPVLAAFVNHPGITLAYRLCTPCGGVAFMPDAEILPFPRPGATRPGESAPPGLEDHRNRLLAEFVQGAEVFICNGQYSSNEYKARSGRGHSCVDDAVALALEARVRRLVLFHHDPAHDDDAIDRLTAHARELVAAAGSTLEVEAAAEGQELVLHRRPRTNGR